LGLLQPKSLHSTHCDAAACYLADRIILYTPKPTRIAAELEVALPRPREYGSEDLYVVEKHVLDVFERSLKSFMSTNAAANS
jgi:ABC-type nitrate/sulfonate/bicarbonate transport system ATPase subunit